MKRKNKYHDNERVILKTTGEVVTIKGVSFVNNMNRYSYTIKENPSTFYFEEEIKSVEE